MDQALRLFCTQGALKPLLTRSQYFHNLRVIESKKKIKTITSSIYFLHMFTFYKGSKWKVWTLGPSATRFFFFFILHKLYFTRTMEIRSWHQRLPLRDLIFSITEILTVYKGSCGIWNRRKSPCLRTDLDKLCCIPWLSWQRVTVVRSPRHNNSIRLMRTATLSYIDCCMSIVRDEKQSYL